MEEEEGRELFTFLPGRNGVNRIMTVSIDINFYKVLTLPVSLRENSVYFVENGDYAETYVTDFNGVAKAVGNSVMIADISTAGAVNWSAIIGKPTSSAAAIDAAVTASHTHSNSAVLAALTDSAGSLIYGGTAVLNWETTAW